MPSQDDDGDESARPARPPETSADQIPDDDEDHAPPSVQSETVAPDDLEEAEPGTTEESAAPTSQEHAPHDTAQDAFDDSMLTLERGRDAQRNIETRPPGGEIVTFRSITIAEAYIGREADSLGTALGAIAWIKPSQPTADEMVEARGEYYPGKFVLASAAAPDLTMREYGQVRLPAGITRIYGRIHVIGPSTVAAALTFVLTDTEALRMNTALLEDAESRIDKTGSTQRTPVTVYQEKSQRINLIYRELSERCVSWLQDKFPGTLTARDGLEVPLCSLVSLVQGHPFQTQGDYMRLLGLSGNALASVFVLPDYLRMAPRISSTARSGELVAAFNEADAMKPGSYPVLSVIPEIVHEQISPLMVMRAMIAVLRALELRMRDVRSDLEKLDFDGATDTQVIGLRNKLLGLSRDIAIICGDLTAFVDDSIFFWSDYPRLTPLNPALPSEGTADAMQRDLRGIITNIQAQEAGLRELVLVTSQSIGDVNDAKLQGKVLSLTDKLGRLTVWLVILTGVVLALTVASVIIGALQLASTSPSGPAKPSCQLFMVYSWTNKC